MGSIADVLSSSHGGILLGDAFLPWSDFLVRRNSAGTNEHDIANGQLVSQVGGQLVPAGTIITRKLMWFSNLFRIVSCVDVGMTACKGAVLAWAETLLLPRWLPTSITWCICNHRPSNARNKSTKSVRSFTPLISSSIMRIRVGIATWMINTS